MSAARMCFRVGGVCTPGKSKGVPGERVTISGLGGGIELGGGGGGGGIALGGGIAPARAKPSGRTGEVPIKDD